MNRPHRVVLAALLVVGAVAASGQSRADICRGIRNSTAPGGIALVGTNAGVPDRFGQFTVTVRDFGNNLIPNCDVIVDFTGALSSVRIQALQPFAGLTVDCTTHTVRALTNASGVATFDIVGTSIPPAAPNPTATIYAAGCSLGPVPVVAFDLDGVGGIGANDLAVWTGYFLHDDLQRVGDYDRSGRLGANDLAIWASVFFQAGSTVSASPLCP